MINSFAPMNPDAEKLVGTINESLAVLDSIELKIDSIKTNNPNPTGMVADLITIIDGLATTTRMANTSHIRTIRDYERKLSIDKNKE